MINEEDVAAIWVSLDRLKEWKDNPRKNEEAVGPVAKSIKECGFGSPIVARLANGEIINGNTRYKASRDILKLDRVPVRFMDVTEEEAHDLALRDNKTGEIAGWDNDLLAKINREHQNIDLSKIGWTDEEIKIINWKPEDFLEENPGHGFSLNDNPRYGRLERIFGMSPFSVLDTRAGSWIEKSRLWKKKIGESGESRERVFTAAGNLGVKIVDCSILDPVLAELMVRWFGGKGWSVLDPFAGDTVFGYVASSMGMNFVGIELRQEQADLNNERTKHLTTKYICDDGKNLQNHIEKESMDMVFSCPPYADLEVYSDNPDDLSTMDHEDFFEVYKDILSKTYSVLKQNRFAVIVTSEVRNKKFGNYIGLVPKTIQIMVDAGYHYYNEVILVNAVGSLQLRVERYMRSSRKIGRCHQNVLIFFKGDPKKIRGEFPSFPLGGHDG